MHQSREQSLSGLARTVNDDVVNAVPARVQPASKLINYLLLNGDPQGNGNHSHQGDAPRQQGKSDMVYQQENSKTDCRNAQNTFRLSNPEKAVCRFVGAIPIHEDYEECGEPDGDDHNVLQVIL